MSHHNNRIHSLITFIIIACTSSMHGEQPQQGAGILPFVYHPETKVGYLVMGYGIDGFSDFGGLKDDSDTTLMQTAMRKFGEKTGYKNLLANDNCQNLDFYTATTTNLNGEIITYKVYLAPIDFNALIHQTFIANEEKFGIGLIPGTLFFDAVKDNLLEKKIVTLTTTYSKFDEERFFFQGYRIQKALLAGLQKHLQKRDSAYVAPDPDSKIIVYSGDTISDGLAKALEKEGVIKQINKVTGEPHSDIPKDKTTPLENKGGYRWFNFIKRNPYYIVLAVAALGLALITKTMYFHDSLKRS